MIEKGCSRDANKAERHSTCIPKTTTTTKLQLKKKIMPSKWTERASLVGSPVFPVWSAQRVKAQSELNCKKLVSKGNCSHRSS